MLQPFDRADDSCHLQSIRTMEPISNSTHFSRGSIDACPLYFIQCQSDKMIFLALARFDMCIPRHFRWTLQQRWTVLYGHLGSKYEAFSFRVSDGVWQHVATLWSSGRLVSFAINKNNGTHLHFNTGRSRINRRLSSTSYSANQIKWYFFLRNLKYFICCMRDRFSSLVWHLSNSTWTTSISGVISSWTSLYTSQNTVYIR